MQSWLCNVRRKATEDWLTAMKCRPVGTDVTIKSSPSPHLASQHQNFTCTSPLAAFRANIDCPRTDLFLLVHEGVVLFERFPRSDDEAFRHFLTIGYLNQRRAKRYYGKVSWLNTSMDGW